MDTVIIVGIIILMIAMLMLVFTHSLVLQHFGIMEFFALLTVSGCIYFAYQDSATIITEQYDALISAQVSGLQTYIGELEDAGRQPRKRCRCTRTLVPCFQSM